MIVGLEIRTGTVMLDLSLSSEDLWKDAHSKNRWSVNKAKKLGVTVSQSGDPRESYELYLRMCELNELIPLPSEHVFIGRHYTARFEGVLAAFAVVLEDPAQSRAELAHNASNYSCRDSQANSLLYWTFIADCKERQILELDLGGIDLHADHKYGIDRFKIRWGGAVVERVREVGPLKYLWWRHLRSYAWLRKLRYVAGMRLLRVRSSR